MAGDDEAAAPADGNRRTPALVPDDLRQQRDLSVAVFVRVAWVGDKLGHVLQANVGAMDGNAAGEGGLHALTFTANAWIFIGN